MEREKRCPQCDFVNLEDAVLCISCAEQLPSENQQIGHVGLVPSLTPGQIACPYCTYLNQPGNKICDMCAKTIEWNAERESENWSQMVSCNRCTFRNPGTSQRCRMCDSELVDECPTPEADQNVEAANASDPGECIDTYQNESMQTSQTNMPEETENRIAAENLKTADANESEDNAGNLHSDDASSMSYSASRACNPVMSNINDPKLDKMCEHVGDKNTIMGSNDDQILSQMADHDVTLSRDPGECRLHSTDDNSLSSFVHVERNDLEDTREAATSVSMKQHGSCERRPDRYDITDGPVAQPGREQGDITYLIKDACEDMDPAFEDYDQQIRCPHCNAACPSTYEQDRKIICKCGFCFCAGCDREYKDCPTKVECKRGPHCHHPRNCIYYLRKLSRKSLERILTKYNSEYDNYMSWMCEEEKKGREVKTMHSDHDCTEIFCKPYEEYLIGKIKLYKLDPADVMTEKELETVIKRESLIFPNDRSLQGLREFLKRVCPLR